MKKILLIAMVALFVASTGHCADLQRGQTFTADDTVTSTKLHNLVDNASLTNIDQADIKANYGLSERSSSQPTDTDSLWIDTSNNCLKAYVSSAYEEVGTTPTTVTTTGDITSGDDVIVSDDVNIGGLLTVDETTYIGDDATVVGHLFANSIFSTWDITTFSTGTNYLAPTDGIITASSTVDTGSSSLLIYNGASNPADVIVATCRDSDGETSDVLCITAAVAKGQYWKVDVGNSSAATVRFLTID